MSVLSNYLATAMKPSESIAKLREKFQLRDVTDDLLLQTLASVSLSLLSRDANVASETLLQSYVDQKGKCALCNLAMAITQGSGSGSSDWSIDCTRSPPYQLAHSFCVQGSATRSNLVGGAAGGGGEVDRLLQERKWIESVLSLTDAKLSTGPTAPVLKGMLAEFVVIDSRLRDLLREANEPPNSLVSRWQDVQKTRLLKRCHTKLCCGQWNPVSTMRLRRALKPGQMDSSDYFDCYCPARGSSTRVAQKATLVMKPPPSSFSSSANDAKLAGAAEKLNGMMHAQRESDLFTSQQELVFTNLTRVANATYEQHRKLLDLYVGSDCKTLLPSAATANAELDQWQRQAHLCGVCGQLMQLYDAIKWDIYCGRWFWMHARCDSNPWAKTLANHVLDTVAEFQHVYVLRHENQQLFDQLVRKLLVRGSDDDDSGDIPWEEILAEMRVRLANLAEQSMIQLRYIKNDKLVADFHMCFEQIKQIDPEILHLAKEAFLQDLPAPVSAVSWKSRKKRRVKKNLPDENDHDDGIMMLPPPTG